MVGDAKLLELDDDWVVIDSKTTSHSTYHPQYSFIRMCKKVGGNVVVCYKKAIFIYRVYRVVRMCINIYILYCALQ